ncbi:hypothetical protein HDV00_000849 [Rhizophlyctis rosea]|nr:hypothetical protein HDV00_000849 [Rhizophlyctis rosea]
MLPTLRLRVPINHLQDKHADELVKILNQDGSTDACLVVGAKKRVINAHRGVLCASSEFFKAMFSTREYTENVTGTIDLPTLEPCAVRAVVTWMYTGHCCSKCFLLEDAPDTYISQSGARLAPLEIALLLPTTLQYFLISPMPNLAAILERIGQIVRMKRTTHSQIESWIIIQNTQIEHIMAAAISVLASNSYMELSRILSLAEVTENVDHLKGLLEAAKEVGIVNSCYGIVQLVSCLVEWADAKEGKEDVTALKATLLDFLKVLGDDFL